MPQDTTFTQWEEKMGFKGTHQWMLNEANEISKSIGRKTELVDNPNEADIKVYWGADLPRDRPLGTSNAHWCHVDNNNRVDVFLTHDDFNSRGDSPGLVNGSTTQEMVISTLKHELIHSYGYI